MNNIISRYKTLPTKSQFAIVLAIFIIIILILPNAVAYAFGALASYKLIKKKSWMYGATAFLCFATLISGLLSLAGDTPKNQVATSAITPQEERDTEVKTTKAVLTNDSKIAEKSSSIPPVSSEPPSQSSQKTYSVVKVVDGDTIDVSINGKVERLRLIGINTPETVDPRKPVECFGVEASNKAKSLLTGKKVSLESDSSQGELDKYNRLLRYVFLEDGTNFNLLMIKQGYAYEYTYGVPYKYQSEFKKAQRDAMNERVGLWGDICQTPKVSQPTITPATTLNTISTNNANSCTIKGNISSSGEKIYHVVGCGSYSKTTIDEGNGERWFCSEQEAVNAGWRKALNCN